MSERELERLHAGLVKLAALPAEEVQALVRHLLTDTPPTVTASTSSAVNHSHSAEAKPGRRLDHVRLVAHR
jgi:hypothetical protein